MRSVVYVALVTGMLMVCVPAVPRASSAGDTRAEVTNPDAPSLSSSVFHADRSAGSAVRDRPRESLVYMGTRVSVPPPTPPGGVSGFAPETSTHPGHGKRTAIAVLSSALLPGLGELYLYFDSKDWGTLARVPLFFAIEGSLWYGYYSNHDKGKDIEADFRRFADEHWDLDRFLHQHPCCNQGAGDSCASWQDYNKNCINEPNYFYYTPKEMDEQEYYENIGKYNAFVFGWDDAAEWDYDNPNEFDEYDYWTPHREYYWSLRGDSDKYLKRADQCLMLLLVNRVASMIDAGWIAHQMSKGEDPEAGWSLRLRTYDEAPSLMVSRRF